jgi:two-component system sensor histidine kinase TctE
VPQDGRVLVEVEDNGPGVPEAEREHVFERFVRGTEDGSGCGLGLAIVREIVGRHHGSVQLLAAQPQGVIAQLNLPSAPAD